MITQQAQEIIFEDATASVRGLRGQECKEPSSMRAAGARPLATGG